MGLGRGTLLRGPLFLGRPAVRAEPSLAEEKRSVMWVPHFRGPGEAVLSGSEKRAVVEGPPFPGAPCVPSKVLSEKRAVVEGPPFWGAPRSEPFQSPNPPLSQDVPRSM